MAMRQTSQGSTLEESLKKSTQRIAELESRVKQLEGALTDLSQWQSDDVVAGIGDYDQGLMCGVEDRGFQKDGYSAMRYGYDRALERVSERIDGVIQQALSPSPPAVEVERVIICPECYQPCTQDHNSFKCDFCQKLWPKGHGHETYELPDDTPPVQTEEKPSVDAYISQLYTDWCECSPYGEQVPDEWPELMASFANEHAGKSPSEMSELIMEASSDDSFEKLLLSIFRTSCQFVLHDLSNAVYDHDQRKLALIGLDERKTEEKPATVPMAVAEGLADALGEAETALASCYDVCDYPGNGKSEQDDALRVVRSAIATFQASTKE